MYWCMKFIMTKMTVVVHLSRGHFCDSLDFFRVRLHVSVTKGGALESDLEVFYLIIFTVEHETIVMCHLHEVELVVVLFLF